MTENPLQSVRAKCLKRFESSRTKDIHLSGGPAGTILSIRGLGLICILGTALLLAPMAGAQGIILRGGGNFSTAALDPEPAAPAGTDMRKGFNAALMGELGGGPVRLMIGGGYENRGVTLTGAGGGDIALDYVTIPVMIGMGPPSISASACVFVNIGVEPAFLVASRVPAGNGALSEEDIKDFDFSGRVELGIELPASYSGPSLLLGGAYTLGLTDINRGDDSWRNQAFHLFVGLKLRSL